jgi:protein O-GlcNAc transferase
MTPRDVIALYGAERHKEAEEACRVLLSEDAHNATLHNVLGAILLAQGEVQQAIESIQAAIRIDPTYAQAMNNLGNAYRAEGLIQNAAEAFTTATRLAPNLQPAHANLGIVLKELGRTRESLDALEEAVSLDPSDAEAKIALGAVLIDLGRAQDAKTVLTEAVALAPDLAEAHSNLGNALQDLNEIEAAISAYDRAIATRPSFAVAHYNRGTALIRQGRIVEGVSAYQRALAFDPENRNTASNLLFALNYLENATPEDVARRHRALAPSGSARPTATTARHGLSATVRIGYVSPDLRDHSVAFFLLPLLEARDRTRVHVTCYAAAPESDAVTARLRAASDAWRNVADFSTDRLRKAILDDGIDILVDLAGHSGRNRLDVFAHRAAPVQVSWLGYPCTTGLETMDFRLTDAVADPPGDADTLHTETLIRVSDGFLCYRPGTTQDIAPSPFDDAGGVMTFGSFNNLPKINEGTVGVWAAILRDVPNSRLLLKSRHLADPATRFRYVALFGSHGIDASRLDLRAHTPRRSDHFASYGDVDIALDPFPYNGTTTTCEALWMGVPVVTLRGDRHAARVGASLLTQIGRPDWIAESTEDYVAIARRLAASPDTLRKERADLRARVEASPLRDEAGFARRIERIYKDLADASSSSSSVSRPRS